MNTALSATPSGRRSIDQIAPLTAAKAHLIFIVHGEHYACPIESIEHVLRRTDAAVRPNAADAAPWEAGRLVHQNRDLPIISLRALWNLPAPTADTGREALLVINLPGQPFALLVDECRSVISSLPPGSAQFPLPAQLRGTRGIAFDTALRWQNHLIITVRLNKLFASEFDTLLASPQPVSAKL